MPRSNFLDVNVWIALIWGGHVHSLAAQQWFDQAEKDMFFFCRFTEVAVLRLLTTKSVMGNDTQTMAAAWKLWDRVTADSRISLLVEPTDLEVDFRSRSQLPNPSPKVWADAYLLAFAAAADLKFVTFDRSLKSRGADVLVL